jgi:hypothetical protein
VGQIFSVSVVVLMELPATVLQPQVDLVELPQHQQLALMVLLEVKVEMEQEM